MDPSFPIFPHLISATYLPPHSNHPTPHPLNPGAQFLILIPLSQTPPIWSIIISYLLIFIYVQKQHMFGNKEIIEATTEVWNVPFSLPCLQHAPPRPLAHPTSSKMDANMKWTNTNHTLGKGIYDFWFGIWGSFVYMVHLTLSSASCPRSPEVGRPDIKSQTRKKEKE